MSEDGRRGLPDLDRGPNWIDDVIDKATDRAVSSQRPVVPEPQGAPARPQAVRDQLEEIRWVEPPDVHPASEPIAPQPDVVRAPNHELTSDAVGRSAWSEDLHHIEGSEPEGWDRLSWHDLDGDSPRETDPLPEPNSFVRLVREWGPVLLAAVVIALFTRLVLVQAYHIPSLSMAPTLQEHDRVIVNRLSYNFGDVERGQVVVFSTPPNQQSDANDLIKRVIALPGETIQFRDGEVYVDGLLVQEPYLSQQLSTRPRSFDIPGCAGDERAPDKCTVPEGFVFVMGDNRAGSQDSRVFGPVPIDTIVGRAFVRVWPITNIGGL